MDISYVCIPFIAWVSSGCVKFLINSIRFGNKSFELIGYGGFPSTHTSIITSVSFLILFKESFESPVFGLAITCALIFVMDAISLRKRIGQHAKALNVVNEKLGMNEESLRERMGHTFYEVLGGAVVGLSAAYLVFMNAKWFHITNI